MAEAGRLPSDSERIAWERATAATISEIYFGSCSKQGRGNQTIAIEKAGRQKPVYALIAGFGHGADCQFFSKGLE
jgi:hypothetical protein